MIFGQSAIHWGRREKKGISPIFRKALIGQCDVKLENFDLLILWLTKLVFEEVLNNLSHLIYEMSH